MVVVAEPMLLDQNFSSSQVDDDVVVVAWHTPLYADRARELQESCHKFRTKCDIVAVPDSSVDAAGSFQAFKVLFILAKLLQHGGRIVYADADLILEAPIQRTLPSLWPKGTAEEKGYHHPDGAFFNWRMYLPSKPPTIATGALYLADTFCSRNLLLLWLAAMAYGNNTNGAADDRVLSFLFADLFADSAESEIVQRLGHGKCSFAWLPPEYLHLKNVRTTKISNEQFAPIESIMTPNRKSPSPASVFLLLVAQGPSLSQHVQVDQPNSVESPRAGWICLC